MAKRKKLNKNVIIVLITLGGVLLLLTAAGVWKFRHQIFRKDPVACVRLAKAEWEKGDYRAADDSFGDALKAIYFSGRTDPETSVYYYDYAQFLLDWAGNRRQEMTDAQRRECFTGAVSFLRRAILRDPNYVDAQRRLTDIAWDISRSSNQWVFFISEADRLLALVPTDHKTCYLRARAWEELARNTPGQNTENAIRDFKKTLELKPDEPQYWEAYALFLQQEERMDETDKVYNDALKAIPDSPELRVGYASFLRARNQPAEALRQIQETIKQAPKSPVGYLALAQTHLMDNKTDLALKALDEAKKIDENDYRIYAFLAQIYRTQKEPSKAIQTLRDGLAAIDRRLKGIAASEPNGGGTTRMDGNRRLLAYTLADSLLDQAVADPNQKDQYTGESKSLVEQVAAKQADPARQAKVSGRIAYMEGDIPKARQLLEEAYQGLGANDIMVADYLIRIYLLHDHLPGKAEKILDRIRRNPAYTNDPKSLLLKAQLEIQYHNFEQAARYAEEAIKADPNNEEAVNIRKSILAAQGRLTPDQVLANTDASSSSSIALLVNRASEMWSEEDRDGAVRLLEAVRAKVPKNEQVLDRLLSMYMAREDQARSLQLIQQAKVLFPDRIATLELQERALKESDPNKRLEIALSAADATTEPFQKAIEKANIAAMFRNEPAMNSFIQEAAKINPDHPTVVERLFRIALANKDWTKAEECAKRATQANLDAMGGRLFRAQLAMAQGQYAQAIPLLAEAVKLKPDAKLPSLMIGDCYRATKDIAKAREAYEVVANNDPGYTPAIVRMAMITEQQGKMDEHADWIARAYRLAPSDPYVRRKYLEMLEEKNASPTEVIAQRLKMLRRNPEDLDNRLRLAVLYERVKQYAQAEEMYGYVYERSPNKLTATGFLAGFYARTNRLNDADRLLVNLLQTYPDKVAAYLLYGEFLSGRSAAQARNAVEKAITLDPNDPRGHLAQGRLLAATGDPKGACGAMTKYLELRPNDQAAKREQIRYYVDADEFAEAQKQLEAILTADPSDTDALHTFAILMLRQGEMSKAMGFLDRAIQAKPDYAEALSTRATVYMTEGKVTEAKMDLEKAARQSNTPSILLMRLVSIHVRMGDLARAQTVLRDILDKPETADYAPAMSMLTDLYLQQQRWQPLSILLERAKAKYPDDPHYRLAEAKMYKVSGDRTKALAVLEQAATDLPGSISLIQEYLLALMEGGQYARLLSVSQPYLDKSGYESWLSALRAEALAKSGDTGKADETFLAAMKGADSTQLVFVKERLIQAYGMNPADEKLTGWLVSHPKDPMVCRVTGMLCLDRQDYAKAVEMFLKAIEYSADDKFKGETRRELALGYYQLKKFPQAEEAYMEALKTSPEEATLKNNLAYMYANDVGQPDKALPYAEQAASAMSQNADVLDTYGWTLAKLSRYSDAERQLLRAVQVAETPSQALLPRYHLGFVYEQMGRLAEALRQYRQAGDILNTKTSDPLYKELNEAIKRAQQKQAGAPASRSAA